MSVQAHPANSGVHVMMELTDTVVPVSLATPD